jgi:hypothetical protein
VKTIQIQPQQEAALRIRLDQTQINMHVRYFDLALTRILVTKYEYG